MQVRARTLTATLSLALLAAACGGETVVASREGTTSSSATGVASGPGSSSGSPTSATEIPEILEFEAPLLGGGTFRGADHAGKDVAFWFWAPW